MPSYLVHFNRLHDKKGRFTYGDGDGDGRRDDRKIGEGDRSYDTPNSGRRNYEGGGGGRIGGGRTKNSATSKSEQTKDNDKPWTKREYGKTELDYAPKNGKRITGDPRAAESSQARSLANQHSRSFTNQHTGTIKSVPGNAISKYGPVTPKTPGIGDGSGRSKGDWSSNSSGKGSNQQYGKSINFVGYPKNEGSNITVVGGSSKGADLSLSSEQVENYKVAGESWVADTIDKITDPEWWKEKEKKARVQLGVYVKADKTAPKKQEKKKMR